MFTSGLVVTLRAETPLAEAALNELQAGPFLLGAGGGWRWPVVLEASDPEAAERWHRWAADLPGVAGVEVVFVHWDEGAEVAHAGA
jgi:hypothetical protein